MSCEKCCYNPCDKTDDICPDGIYYRRDHEGYIIKIITMPKSVAKVVEKAVLDALESEIK